MNSSTYRSLMSSLRYLTHTRPYLMCSVRFLGHIMENPSSHNLVNAKRVLKYIKGTLNLSLRYKKGKTFELEGYSDNDYGGDMDDRKIRQGIFFFLGGNVVI